MGLSAIWKEMYGYYTCESETCEKEWPSNRSRETHQAHVGTEAQEKAQFRNASRPSLRKSCQSGVGQVKNHRANLKDNQFLHQKKVQLINTNEVCGKVKSKSRLNLPKPGDQRAWKELNVKLSETLESPPIYKESPSIWNHLRFTKTLQ